MIGAIIALLISNRAGDRHGRHTSPQGFSARSCVVATRAHPWWGTGVPGWWAGPVTDRAHPYGLLLHRLNVLGLTVVICGCCLTEPDVLWSAGPYTVWG